VEAALPAGIRLPRFLRERERELGRERKGRERNKIWNSGYRVWDRGNTSAEEMSIE
jgi:hypothetical protein